MKIELEISKIEKLLRLPQSELKVSRESLWSRLMVLNCELAKNK